MPALRYGVVAQFNKGFIGASEKAAIAASAISAVAPTETIAQAHETAGRTWTEEGATGKRPGKVSGTERQYDAARQRLIDIVRLTDEDGGGPWIVHVDIESGEVYTQYPEDSMFSDARLERATYSSGDLLNPSKVTETSVYTRDSNELVHDFFYIMSDIKFMVFGIVIINSYYFSI